MFTERPILISDLGVRNLLKVLEAEMQTQIDHSDSFRRFP